MHINSNESKYVEGFEPRKRVNLENENGFDHRTGSRLMAKEKKEEQNWKHSYSAKY